MRLPQRTAKLFNVECGAYLLKKLALLAKISVSNLNFASYHFTAHEPTALFCIVLKVPSAFEVASRQVPSAKSQVPSPKCQVPSAKYRVTSEKCQVPSVKYRLINICQYWLILANVGQYWPILPIAMATFNGEKFVNIYKYWPILANIGKCWPMLANIAKSNGHIQWRKISQYLQIMANIFQYWQMLANIGQYCQ